jgi:hypothetical protein
MSDLYNIKDYKNNQKIKKLLEELDGIEKVIETSLRAFNLFKHFFPVQECISVLQTNLTLIKINKSKYKKQLKSNKDES